MSLLKLFIDMKEFNFENINNYLLQELKINEPLQLQQCFDYEYNELEDNFLAFVEQYYALSLIIPQHFTIVDLGCYMGLQSYFFKNHKKYIGINEFGQNNTIIPKLHLSNTEYFNIDIFKFLKSKTFKKLKLETTFAICNYVPTWNEKKQKNDKSIINKSFSNIFTFDPAT